MGNTLVAPSDGFAVFSPVFAISEAPKTVDRDLTNRAFFTTSWVELAGTKVRRNAAFTACLTSVTFSPIDV